MIPRGMANAFIEATRKDPSTFSGLEAAIAWIEEKAPTHGDEVKAFEAAVEDPRILPDTFSCGWNACAEFYRRLLFRREPEISDKVLIDPSKCPHRWNAKDDLTTAEQVVYCELCGWEYSRTSLESIRR